MQKLKAFLPKLKYLIAFGLIYYLVASGKLDFKLFLKIESYSLLLVAILFSFLNTAAINYRWTLLLWDKGFKCSLKETFNLTLMGIFFNYSLPSSIGGDAVKAYYLAKDNADKRMLAITSVMVDRLLGLFVMVSIGLLALLFNLPFVQGNADLLNILYFSSIAFLSMGFGLLMVFSEAVKNLSFIQKLLGMFPELLVKVYEALNSYGQSKKTVLKVIFYSFLAQFFAIGFMVSIGSALGFDLPLGVYFFAVPVGFIIMSIPISPGGVGVGQLAFLQLFKIFLGESTEVGTLAITAFQIVLFCWGLIGAYHYAKRSKPTVIQEVK